MNEHVGREKNVGKAQFNCSDNKQKSWRQNIFSIRFCYKLNEKRYSIAMYARNAVHSNGIRSQKQQQQQVKKEYLYQIFKHLLFICSTKQTSE